MPFQKRQLQDIYTESANTFRLPMLNMRTVIVGPAAAYFEENAGYYREPTTLTFTYPQRTLDEKVDLDTIKVLVKNGFLKYFTKDIGTNGTAITNIPNKIRFNDLVLKTANGFTRSNVIPRDVRVGDKIIAYKTVGSNIVKHTSTIIGLEPDTLPPSIGTPYTDPANSPNQSAAGSASQVGGTVNNVAITSVVTANYNSLDDGFISRVYFITVTVGGTPPTAKLRVESADGLDVVNNVTPEPFGTPTPIGTKGAAVIFATSGGDGFVVGQRWQVNISQSFTANTISAGGTYTGKTSKVYTLTVIRGGNFSSPNPPLVRVTTSDGSEFIDNIPVTGAPNPINISNFGVVAIFSAGSNGLRKGDRFHIPVTGPIPQQVRTIILQSELPNVMLNSDLSVDFGYDWSGEIPKVTTYPNNNFNWTANQDRVMVNPIVYISQQGDLVPSQLVEGNIEIHYRYWKKFNNYSVVWITNESQIVSIFGEITEHNPLAFCAKLALDHSPWKFKDSLNRGFLETYAGVMVLPVNEDPTDLDNWQNAIDYLSDLPDIYNIVPITKNKQVIEMFANFITEQSQASVGKYKVLWITAEPEKVVPIVNKQKSSNGENVLATVSDSVETGVFNVVNVTSNNIEFLSDWTNVKPKDKLRINFGTSFDGREIYQEFTIKNVVSNTRLIIDGNIGSPISTATKIEIWRDVKKLDLVDYLVNDYSWLKADHINTKRIRIIYPNVNVSSSFTGLNIKYSKPQEKIPNMSGSIVATIASHTIIHQSLISVKLNDYVSADTSIVSPNYLMELAESGFFVIDQDQFDGSCYIRFPKCLHRNQLDLESVLFRNEVSLRNLDGIIKFIQYSLRQLIGQLNFYEDIEELIKDNISRIVSDLKLAFYTPASGFPVNDVTVQNLNLITTGPDAPRLEVKLNLVGRAIPINEIEFVV